MIETMPPKADEAAEMSSSEFANIISEVQEQPAWRRDADICAEALRALTAKDAKNAKKNL